MYGSRCGLATNVTFVEALHGISNVEIDVRALELCDSAGWLSAGALPG